MYLGIIAAAWANPASSVSAALSSTAKATMSSSPPSLAGIGSMAQNRVSGGWLSTSSVWKEEKSRPRTRMRSPRRRAKAEGSVVITQRGVAGVEPENQRLRKAATVASGAGGSATQTGRSVRRRAYFSRSSGLCPMWAGGWRAGRDPDQRAAGLHGENSSLIALSASLPVTTAESQENQRGVIRMWADNDLTVLAGAAPATSGKLDGYSQGDGSQHVNFIDENGQVHELYRSPDPAAQWVYNDLTAFAGGTQAVGIALAGYSQGDGSQHVNFIDVSGHVHELYRSPDPAAQWVDNDLTAFANGTPAYTKGGFSISPIDAYSQSDSSQHVNFIDSNGHMHELYRCPDPAAQWVDNDLTTYAGGAQAEGGLDAYSQGDSSQHVNFIDGNGNMHELYRSPDPAAQWVDNDLTARGGAARAYITTLDGYSQKDASQHVNFIDENRHVHELYRSPDPAGQWVDNDLTAFTGATQAEGSLDGYSQGDSSQHVNFIDINGDVHELYLSG